MQNPNDPATPPADPATPPPNQISAEEYQRALDDATRSKRAAQEAADALKARELADLQKNQQWQEVAKLKEEEAKQADTKYKELKTALVYKEKLAALKQGALEAGMRKEALSDLRPVDFPELTVETAGDGDLIVKGVDKAMQRLKSLKSYMFTSSTPNVNASTPGVNGDRSGQVTSKEVFAAETAWKKGTGTKAAYEEILRAFQAQKKR